MQKEFKPIIEKYANLIISKLIDNYDRMGLRASGDFEKGLSFAIEGTSLTIYGAFHSQFMENGRSKGGRPPIPSIMRWLENKRGLPPSMLRDKKRTAFAIANKIAKEGITVPNEHNAGEVISMVINDFLQKDIENMIDELGVTAEILVRASAGDLIAA